VQKKQNGTGVPNHGRVAPHSNHQSSVHWMANVAICTTSHQVSTFHTEVMTRGRHVYEAVQVEMNAGRKKGENLHGDSE